MEFKNNQNQMELEKQIEILLSQGFSKDEILEVVESVVQQNISGSNLTNTSAKMDPEKIAPFDVSGAKYIDPSVEVDYPYLFSKDNKINLEGVDISGAKFDDPSAEKIDGSRLEGVDVHGAKGIDPSVESETHHNTR